MPLKTHVDEQPTLNMTPMIDIVFLLIIFFMVGTKFTELSESEQHIPLEVPQVAQAGALSQSPKKRIINVFKDGTLTLDNQTVSLPDLSRQLREAKSDYSELGVIVRGDAGTSFQNVASVLGRVRQAGISDMGISVRLNQTEMR